MTQTTAHADEIRIAYRPDIDGLRAVAVLAVVGFHAAPRLVPGGFIGVDVFFVISGFLISSLIFADLHKGRFRLAEFYARRVRRIFPALVVVLTACWAIGWLVLVQGEYRLLEKHLAAAAAFVPNVALWQEAGYFDARSELKPLLHLWSLGVEEQFYVLWPPLLYLTWKRGLNVLSVATAIVACSFLLNVATIGHFSVAAFYLPQNRIWQLVSGAVLAYVAYFRKREAIATVGRIVFAAPNRYDARFLANALAAIGLALIVTAIGMLGPNTDFPGWWFSVPMLRPVATIFGLDAGALYPGWWALLPTLGAVLVIAAGERAWLNRAFLSHRVIVYVGLISYPLYLWHWPLLAFLRITENGSPSRTLRVAAVSLSFVLAALTYHLVEQPIRRAIPAATFGKLRALVAAMAVIAFLSFYGYRTNAFAPRTPVFATGVDADLLTAKREPHCYERFPTAGEYCQESAPGMTTTTALLGDSHAEHLLEGIGARLMRAGENVVHLGQSGCPPLLGIERYVAGATSSCRAANDSVLNAVGGDAGISSVVLSFRGAADLAGKGFGEVESGGLAVYKIAGTDLSPQASMRLALEQTAQYLIRQGKHVSLVLQVPELGFNIGECVGRPFSFEKTLRAPCAVPRSDVQARQAAYREIVADVARDVPALKVFDPFPYLCDDRSCFGMIDHTLLYKDSNHLNRAGSRFLADKFEWETARAASH